MNARSTSIGAAAAAELKANGVRLGTEPEPFDAPQAFARAFAAGVRPLFYWRAADDDTWLLGAGAAGIARAAGPQRFHEVFRAAAAVQAEAGDLAPLVGGFAFGPDPAPSPWHEFPPAFLFLPRVLYRFDRGRLTVTVAAQDEDGRREAVAIRSALDGPPSTGSLAGPAPAIAARSADFDRWCARVAAARQAIREGRFAKVVLARSEAVPLPADFSLADALARLVASADGTTVFAVAMGASVFVGASPEPLFRRQGDHLAATALAGSAPRGPTPGDDRVRAEELLASEKNRREHELVADFVAGVLADFGLAVSRPPAPGVKRLTHVQHLHTPIVARGKLPPTPDLLAALHPTPALGGHPRGPALAWLLEHEGIERGLYGGLVGWVAPNGDGEWTVAIRSALLQPGRAVLYAGCGILADSSPEAEWEESQLKLGPMKGALGLAP